VIKRICPEEIFTQAHNGLSLFLSEYPHMSKEQRSKICELIEHFALPQYRQRVLRRPGLRCKSRPDGVLFISPILKNP